jgi:hypothetical protein
VAYSVFTRHSTLPPTPHTRAKPKPRNGSTITILTSSTSCQSNMPSAVSRTSARPPRFGSRTRNHRQLPADQPVINRPMALAGWIPSTRDRWFESTSLQRRVFSEPDFLDHRLEARHSAPRWCGEAAGPRKQFT